MSDFYRITPDHQLYFITTSVVGWVDVFTRKDYVEVLVDSLKWCQENQGLKIHGFVIMTNHINLLASSEKLPLNKILKSFKQFVARELLQRIQDNPSESRKNWMINLFKFAAEDKKQNHQFWQHSNRCVALWNTDRIRSALNYIHQNPVEMGWVKLPEHYVYSSARNYALGKEGVLKVDCLDLA